MNFTNITKDFNKPLLKLLKKASFEIFPSQEIVYEVSKLPKKSLLAITCTSNKGVDYAVGKAIELKKNGFDAYPHIAARTVTDENHIKRINTMLRKNNINKIFVAAGDVSKPVGKYTSSMDLLKEFKKIGFSYKEIAIAGYPEGHPTISNTQLIKALQDKQRFAKEKKISMNIVTQMCFDADTIVTWSHSLQSKGILLPIVVGIAGPCSGIKLLQFALRCGVGTSLRFIQSKKELANTIGSKMAFHYTPDTLIENIIRHPFFLKSNIVGFHFYTFNNFLLIQEWMQKFKEDVLFYRRGQTI